MARKYGNIDEVIAAFVNGDEGPHTNSQGNVYFQGDILYSYGSHFPMCVKLDSKQSRNVDFLVNGDRYSVTTSSHQSNVQSALSGQTFFTASLSALRRANLWNGYDFAHDFKIVDSQRDINVYNDIIESQIPDGATIRRDKDGNIINYHRPATALLFGNSQYWICGMDDGSYFISRLPYKAKSLKHAFKMLKPRKVKKYEKEHRTVERQGEWFFIPFAAGKEAKQLYSKMAHVHEDKNRWNGEVKTKKGWILPRESNDSNAHIATRGTVKNKRVLVSGQVRHSDHPMIRLSTFKDVRVFEAVRNTALESYSEAGVD